jgi:hypothetical protein
VATNDLENWQDQQFNRCQGKERAENEAVKPFSRQMITPNLSAIAATAEGLMVIVCPSFGSQLGQVSALQVIQDGSAI